VILNINTFFPDDKLNIIIQFSPQLFLFLSAKYYPKWSEVPFRTPISYTN
jgi:hypothetical protein